MRPSLPVLLISLLLLVAFPATAQTCAPKIAASHLAEAG